MPESYPLPCKRCDVIRIDVIPDEILLIIFDFYVVPDLRSKPEIEKWTSLVHVCRRWRNLVFGSPRRLNLRLFCTPETPSRDTLYVWPALPLIIDGNMSFTSNKDNIDFALEHNNRIHEVGLWGVEDYRLGEVLAAMQVPFPMVTRLGLAAIRNSQTLQSVPNSFLGGSAPSLRSFFLGDILFPGLSKLLLSAPHLVDLHLHLPYSAYIPPEEMVTCLSVLTSIENFTLRFQSLRPHPNRLTQRSPLATCSVLSALRVLQFRGSSGYLDDLVARIDAPRLYLFYMTFNQTNLAIPQLIKFISRISALQAPVGARAVFEFDAARVELISQTFGHGVFSVEFPYTVSPELQLSSLVQVLASSSHLLSTVENLYIEDQGSCLMKTSRVEVTQWWEFLRPFVSMKNIHLFTTIAFHIAYSLQELGGGRSIEVLPALQNIFLRPEVGPPDPSSLVRGPMGQFVAARRLLGHSIIITVSDW